MSYSTNPYAPRARREAINLVLVHGYTAAAAARKTGVTAPLLDGGWRGQKQTTSVNYCRPARAVLVLTPQPFQQQ